MMDDAIRPSPAMMDLLVRSFARLSGPTQMRLLVEVLPAMPEADQIALLPALAEAMQPHLLRPLLRAINARIEEEGIEA